MKKLTYFIPATALLAGLLIASSAFAASYFSNPRAATAAATSTITYMTPGNATTTAVYDAYGANGTNQNTNNTGNTFAAEEAALVVQFSASNTTSTLNINFEYSDDKVDWYQDTATNINGYSTSTVLLNLGTVPQYKWTFASSTVGQQTATSTNNIDTRALKIRPITRYTRAIFTCTVSNCGVWAQFIPRKNN